MKFRSEQSARTWSETAEWLSPLLSGVTFGAFFCLWFDAGNVIIASTMLGLVFSVIDLKTGFRARKERVEERLDALRYRGLYPPDGEGNDDDVKRLKDAGYKAQAFRLYRELHGTSPGEAQDAVNAL